MVYSGAARGNHEAGGGRSLCVQIRSAPQLLYGRIVSEADRDIDPEEIVKRCVEYGKAHAPELTRQEQLNRAEEHIRQKYGEDGYLHLWLPCSRNEQGLSTPAGVAADGNPETKAEKYL